MIQMAAAKSSNHTQHTTTRNTDSSTLNNNSNVKQEIDDNNASNIEAMELCETSQMKNEEQNNKLSVVGRDEPKLEQHQQLHEVEQLHDEKVETIAIKHEKEDMKQEDEEEQQ